MLQPTTPSARANWSLLALAVATGLLYALGIPVVGADLAGQGLEQISHNGCTAITWRDPVTGRHEVRRGHLDPDGLPVCR